jgi:hypothetical protein
MNLLPEIDEILNSKELVSLDVFLTPSGYQVRATVDTTQTLREREEEARANYDHAVARGASIPPFHVLWNQHANKIDSSVSYIIPHFKNIFHQPLVKSTGLTRFEVTADFTSKDFAEILSAKANLLK